MRLAALTLPLAAGLGLIAMTAAPSPAATFRAPAPTRDVPVTAGLETAVFAGGCFWGVEGVFQHVRGVRRVVSGYAGGSAADANYRAVSAERTDHAEVVSITYDPRQVSYGRLLQIHFSVVHDPTQLNRQGPDTGRSYRSAIFPQDRAQAAVANAYLAQLRRSGAYPRPVVTRIEQGRFFPAEAAHQDFLNRNPDHPYIRRHDLPKIAAFRAAYPTLWRATPAA